MILVLDLGLGQRRAAVDAPVHRLLALVDQALLDEPAERARDRRLVLEVHRQVRRVPRAEDAEPLELLGHRADEALGVRAAGAAEVGDRHLALLRAELAIDLQLDRQAVAVVADDVRRVEAGHRARLDDELLENLVERRAHVDVAVGVRRAVVQHELRRALPALANLPVEVHRGPAGERLGLAGRQVRLHREVGARQVDGVFPLRHGYPTDSIMIRCVPRALDNGLKVLIQEEHTAPLASVWCWYKVGSKDERPGLTGVSHWSST